MIEINGKRIPIPSTWNDLTLRQALACYQIIGMDTWGIFSAEELLHAKRLQIMMELCNIDHAFLEDWKAQEIEADPAEGANIFYSGLNTLSNTITAFAFQEKAQGGYQLALTYTKTPWPYLEAKYRGGKLRLYAPADQLSNVTIYELGMSFMALERFLQDQDEDALFELLAILYRPMKPATAENKRSAYQGDRRLPLLHHEATLPARKKHMRKLPELVRNFLVFWFASCRQQIISSYPNIFSSNPHGTAGEAAGNDYAWGGVLLNLADGLPNLDAVAQQHYANALTYLSMLEDQRKKHEMEMARQKRESRRSR